MSGGDLGSQSRAPEDNVPRGVQLKYTRTRVGKQSLFQGKKRGVQILANQAIEEKKEHFTLVADSFRKSSGQVPGGLTCERNQGAVHEGGTL